MLRLWTRKLVRGTDTLSVSGTGHRTDTTEKVRVKCLGLCGPAIAHRVSCAHTHSLFCRSMRCRRPVGYFFTCGRCVRGACPSNLDRGGRPTSMPARLREAGHCQLVPSAVSGSSSSKQQQHARRLQQRQRLRRRRQLQQPRVFQLQPVIGCPSASGCGLWLPESIFSHVQRHCILYNKDIVNKRLSPTSLPGCVQCPHQPLVPPAAAVAPPAPARVQPHGT